jgi:hypothetical protein
MARTTQTDRDDAAANLRYTIHALALDILRQGSSLMTMAEAMAQAQARLRARR